jgi:signal transduction histidine kinase
MKNTKRQKLRWYFRIFRFIAETRLKQEDLDPRPIHTLLVTVLSTGVLMWSYAILAHLTISSPIPGIVGYAMAITHLLSPLLFRFTNNAYLICNVVLASGMIHQGAFSYYSGGFLSFSLKWLAILPMLAGIISGTKGAITWGIVTLFVSSLFLVLELTSYSFPYLITDQGNLIGNALIQFGWIGLSSTLIGVYIILRENNEKLINMQSKSVDELFRVLFHDLANPLGRIDIGLTIANRQKNDPATERGLSIASRAIDAMIEITQNVKKMYVISKEQSGQLELINYSLNEGIQYIQTLFHEPLKEKNITLHYDHKKYQDLKVLVEPISFKNQVLSNIISNAIKFSHENNKIQVLVTPLPQSRVAIEIIDSGVGIPEDLLNDLFNYDKSTSRSGTKGEKGTGLGMQIMKSFVEKYDGEVFIESKEGSGTKLRLVLESEGAVRP